MSKSKSTPRPKTITNNRSAVTGKFVTESYTKRHPTTTTTEHNKLPPKGGK